MSWPLHAEYQITRDEIIRGEGYDGRSYEPLEDPDLFLSFARLGAKGQPSETRILRWVEKHGLLTGHTREGVDQKPMSVYDFQEEVRCARELATLFMDIRDKNAAAIYARFVGEGDYQEAWLHNNPVDAYFAELHQHKDFEDFRRSLEPPNDPVHVQAGAAAFENILAKLIEGVTLQPVSDKFASSEADKGMLHLRVWEPDQPYHPVLSWCCHDLRSALYLQFALMATSTKPWRLCKHKSCRMPFLVTRTDKHYCNATCRSGARKSR